MIEEETFVEIKVYPISGHPQFDFVFIMNKRGGSLVSELKTVVV